MMCSSHMTCLFLLLLQLATRFFFNLLCTVFLDVDMKLLEFFLRRRREKKKRRKTKNAMNDRETENWIVCAHFFSSVEY